MDKKTVTIAEGFTMSIEKFFEDCDSAIIEQIVIGLTK